jgi:hypothetical protein
MRFLFFFLLVISGAALRAQDDALTVDMLVPDKAIKISPLHLINFYPTVQVAYEQKILDRITAQLDIGFVVHYKNTTNPNTQFKDKRGVKGKLEARYYFWGRTDKRKLYYVSGEGYMNAVDFDRQDTRTLCYDLDCTSLYRETYDYKVEYREQGFSVKAGMLKYFSKRILFDINSGFTLRFVNYKKPNLIPGFNEDTMFFLDIPNETKRVAFSPNLGVRFGYRLK